MLKLKRRVGEEIIIGGCIKLTVINTDLPPRMAGKKILVEVRKALGKTLSIGIKASNEILIVRSELIK